MKVYRQSPVSSIRKDWNRLLTPMASRDSLSRWGIVALGRQGVEAGPWEDAPIPRMVAFLNL